MLDHFEFSATNGFRYYAMILEYLPGGDLAHFFQRMQNYVFGLSYIHGKNIKHRDLKPENILLTADRLQVKIADFNISRTSEETIETGVAGSMEYLSPEEINVQGNSVPVTFSQDMWPLGIIFQMLCTFRHPFAFGNHYQTMTNIINNNREPAEVDFPEMEALIQRCLVVDISERAESASALMAHPSLSSLIQQLEAGVRPADLIFPSSREDPLLNTIEWQRGEIEQLRNELAETRQMLHTETEGLGHLTGTERRRRPHDTEVVRRILRAMAAGAINFNFLFKYDRELKVTESGWRLEHSTNIRGRDSGFWKLLLTHNGRRKEFEASGEDIRRGTGRSENLKQYLTPDKNGIVRIEGRHTFIRWNITMKK
ncbi:Oidioi.mRNA.OKI2018_I69.chr2.g4538.t1.cds [Oikopleura dioica]|uniref:Serine/threonine-protein kinase greatwall n=1 Tax=Oikopleura dioica TaxID=34765 RepID=A0ABN7SY30_OIKDI|nr:Oidioi.mRNA.OKI2018_I69.chr2.g4538.t1.cds [Oikopleura dioica]